MAAWTQPDVRLEEIITQARVVIGGLSIQDTFSGSLDADVAALRMQVEPSDDIVFRQVPGAPTACVLVYQRGCADDKALGASVLGHLRQGETQALPGAGTAATCAEAAHKLFAGDVLLLQEGVAQALTFTLSARLPGDQPQVERVIRGPHQAFTPDLYQNIALLRRMAQHPLIRVEILPLPQNHRRSFAIAYKAGEAPLSVRADLLRRLSHVTVDNIVDVTALKPFLADDPYSAFVNVQLTERLDTAALAVLDGRFVLFAGDAAQVLLLPATLIEMMNSPEDLYLPRYIGDMARALRWGSAFVALLGEAIYIAITTLHQELLPTPLAFAVARSRAGVPLPVFAEVLVMALIIEVLREAAIRLPNSLSQTISIVGALVIGQAVVQAGLISAPVIVLVAVVALASFVIPQYEIAIIVRLLRFPAMLAAVILGLYGIALYGLVLLLHLCRLRSFGVSYLSPVAPMHTGQMQRILRVPLHWYRKPQAT